MASAGSTVSRTPGWHVLGRETFLAPVTWDDGDDFDRSELHPSWISVRDRSAEHCTTKERPGSLTLRARGTSLDEPDVVFVGRRYQYRACRARTLIDPRRDAAGSPYCSTNNTATGSRRTGPRCEWSRASARCAPSWPHSRCPRARSSSACGKPSCPHRASRPRYENNTITLTDKFLGSLRNGAPVTLKFHFYSGAALTHHVTKSGTSVTGSTS